MTSTADSGKLPRVRRRGIQVIIALLLATPLTGAAPAHAYIYWGDTHNNTIGRANNDGSGVNDSFIQTGLLPFAVAVDSSHIYWANQNSNSIGRANIDGTGVNNNFITAINKPSGVAVNSNYIFWSSLTGNTVGRADLNGANKLPSLISAQEPCGVALDSGHVYWNSVGSPSLVGRASFDGTNTKLNWVTMNAAGPCGIAVNSANIFWTDSGFLGPNGKNIGRANTSTGEGVDNSTIGDASGPCGIAIDSSSHLYWANAGSGMIGRARTDSTEVNESFFATGGNEICGVAVDNLSSPLPPTPDPPRPTPPTPTPTPLLPPTNHIALGKPKRNLKRGTATIAVSVESPGSLVARGKGIAKSSVNATGAGVFKLTLKPVGAAKRALEKSGKATIKANFTFSPSGGTPLTRTKSIALKKKLS